MGDDNRGHLAALRAGGEVRKTSVAPPPRQVSPEPSEPDLPSNPDEGEAPDLTEGEAPEAEAVAPAKPAARRRRRSPETPAEPPAGAGRVRGRQRELQPRITNTAADIVYSIAERDRLTLGQAAVLALRRVHKELREETVEIAVDDDDFAPIEPGRRSLGPADEGKRIVTLRVSGAEAEAVDDLADATRMTYSLLFDVALKRYAESS